MKIYNNCNIERKQLIFIIRKKFMRRVGKSKLIFCIRFNRFPKKKLPTTAKNVFLPKIKKVGSPYFQIHLFISKFAIKNFTFEHYKKSISLTNVHIFWVGKKKALKFKIIVILSENNEFSF